MGGGEAIMIQVANALATTHDIEYFGPSNYRGVLRVSPHTVMSRIRFRYRRVPYYPTPCRLLRGLERPMPALSELRDTDAALIFVDRPICAKYLRTLAETVPVGLLFHGFTVEWPWPPTWPKVVSSMWTWMLAVTNAAAIRGLVGSQTSFQIYNRAQARYLQFLNVPPSRIHYIPNGRPFEDFRVGRDDQCFRVVFMGRIDRLTKGIDMLIDVARRVKKSGQPISFEILGSGPDLPRLQEAARRNDILHARGFTSEGVKKETLQQGNLLLSTSTVEPFSLTVVEALAAGLPVVSTRASGPESILALDSQFGRLPRGGAEGLARFILEYYREWVSDQDAYFRQKLERRDRARELLDESACIEQYRTMIASMTNGTRQP